MITPKTNDKIERKIENYSAVRKKNEATMQTDSEK